MSTTLTEPDGTPFGVEVYRGHEKVKARCIVMPGAQITAKRYRWLGEGLASANFDTLVVDPPAVLRTTPFSPDKPVETRFATLAQLISAIGFWQLPGDPLFLIGHSGGGATILDSLDPSSARSNPRVDTPDDFDGFIGLTGCIILGTSLQAEGMGMRFPGRHDDTPLMKPDKLPVLLISGEHDAMAPPEKVRRTAQRFGKNSHFLCQSGANHLNWASGTGPRDRPDLDGVATIPETQQQLDTLRAIIAFANAILTCSPNVSAVVTDLEHDLQRSAAMPAPQ